MINQQQRSKDVFLKRSGKLNYAMLAIAEAAEQKNAPYRAEFSWKGYEEEVIVKIPGRVPHGICMCSYEDFQYFHEVLTQHFGKKCSAISENAFTLQ